MPRAQGNDGSSVPGTGSGWPTVIRRVALSASVIGACLLPMAAWASDRGIARTDLATIQGSGAAAAATPSPILISATPISDAMLASQEAKGLPESQSVMPQIAHPPRVILWDEIDRPGGWSPTGSGVRIITVTGEP